MLVEIDLSFKDRRRLKRLTQMAMTRLLPQTPELQGILNRGENLAIRVVSSGVGLGIAAAIYFGLPTLVALVEWPDAIADRVPDGARLLVAALAFVWLVIFSPLATWLDTNFMRFWSGAYTFRHKWVQGNTAASVLDASENLIRTRPDKIVEALREASADCPGSGVPQKVMDHVTGFPGPGAPVAVVIRKFMERRLKSDYLADKLRGERRDEREFRERYFLRARAVRNAIRTQLLLNELGAELRAEIPAGSDWYRFYFTDAASQETTLFDSRDFHQRFRTAAPHYGWPVAKSAESVGETALFRVVAAVENPMNQAIYGIAVREVIEAFPRIIRRFIETEESAKDVNDERIAQLTEEYIAILQTIDVQMFGKWDRRTLRPRSDVHIQPQPILRNAAPEGEPADWILRWDPNRIAWSVFDESDGQTRRAFAVLAEAIDQVGKAATPIVLRRGDTLLIDNLRCLVARRELESHQMSNVKRVGLYPQSWWLRGFYGFRQPAARSIYYDGAPVEPKAPPPLIEKEESASLEAPSRPAFLENTGPVRS